MNHDVALAVLFVALFIAMAIGFMLGRFTAKDKE